MNIILFTRCQGKPATVSLTHPRCYLPALAAAVLVLAGIFVAGYQVGHRQTAAEAERIARRWVEDVERQQAELQAAKGRAQQQINALSSRLARMQAHVIRLDALGQRLTQMAGLDKGEFDFDSAPAQGGPEHPADLQPVRPTDFLAELQRVDEQLEDRARQLDVLETLMVNRRLQKEIRPAGRPIERGWLSSYFGKRTDPFTGKREFHYGVDFAGKKGSAVVAVAAGVVTYAGERYGYGKLVEIDHGNGYVTRYGHNEDFSVSVGDAVKRGQPVANMGSTGRSTGPHVHFEVLYHGRVVNPSKYISAER